MASIFQDAGQFLTNPTGPKVRHFGEDGEVRYERIPSTARNGQRIRRWLKVVRTDGHVVNAPLTNAAANIDLGSSVANHYRNKWRKHGWFPIGKCPCTLARSGELNVKMLCKENQKVVKDGGGCQATECSEKDPCSHALKERDVRMKRHVVASEERREKWRTADQKMVAAQQDASARMADVAEQLKDALISTKESK